MFASRRLALLCAALLVVAACGDDSGAEVTITVIPLTSTTTSTTSLPAPDDTLGADFAEAAMASLSGQLFEDPFMGTGFQQLNLDDERGVLISAVPIVATDAADDLLGADLLVISLIQPEPIMTGIGPNQRLVEAWIDNYTGDIVPTAIVLYTLAPDGWVATAVIDSASLEAALLQTTDYDAAAPAGPVGIDVSVTAFDWTARIFSARVAVFDYSAGFDLVYEGEIECTVGDPLECKTLSDDGVLRPGDEGEVVEALQNDLAGLGFLTGVIDGKYGPQTRAAVSAFQADYLLTVDGKAGPNTLELLADIVAGVADLILVSEDRISGVLFGTPADTANNALFALFGPSGGSTGWYVDGCDGYDWLLMSWDGFTAIFTDREGFRQLDGWKVTDLGDLPSGLLIAGGINAGWTWSDFSAAGAGFDPGYGGFFSMPDLSYNNGRFVNPPANPPAGGAAISGFGTGTGAFVTC
ncbi:MAG: peptidoglycan-binding domain-containing protein [Acidimicrobiia bacterium]